MTESQLDQVMAIEQVAYDHPWTLGNFVDSLRHGYQMQGLYSGDTLLGYFVAMRGVDEAHLLNITVAPRWQGQGWSRILLDGLCAWALACQAQTLWLEVRAGNARARQVYQRYGYRELGLRKGYYPAADGQREDAVVMSLPLC